jgi:hypothetical protein
VITGPPCSFPINHSGVVLYKHKIYYGFALLYSAMYCTSCNCSSCSCSYCQIAVAGSCCCGLLVRIYKILGKFQTNIFSLVILFYCAEKENVYCFTVQISLRKSKTNYSDFSYHFVFRNPETACIEFCDLI